MHNLFDNDLELRVTTDLRFVLKPDPLTAQAIQTIPNEIIHRAAWSMSSNFYQSRSCSEAAHKGHDV